MPTPTARLGLSKPLGNETVSRAAYNAVLDEIDAAVAGLAVVNEFTADQGILARGTADSTNTGYDSYDDYMQGSVWDGSSSAPRYRRFVRRVRATPSASYFQMAYQAEGSAEVPLIEISAAGALRPATHGGGSLGEATRRWGAAYVQTLDISASAILANAAYLKAKDSGGTARNVIGVDASNVLRIGDGSLSGAVVAGNLAVVDEEHHQLWFGNESNVSVLRVFNSKPDSIAVVAVRNDAREWHFRVDAFDKLLIYDATDAAIRVIFDPSRKISILNTDRLGYGTDIPEYALDVVASDGVIRAAGLLLFRPLDNLGPRNDAIKITNAENTETRFSVWKSGYVWAPEGVMTKTKAGAPTDDDFKSAPEDGTLVVDVTNRRLYVRVAGAWRYVNLT